MADQPRKAEALLVERRAAEHGEPQDRERAGHQDHAGDELANGAPAADARDEDAHEGRPGDNPDEIGQRPRAQPGRRLAWLEREQLEAQRYDPGGVVADRGQQVARQKGRRADQQHIAQHHEGQQDVGVRDPFDTLVERHCQGRQVGEQQGHENRRRQVARAHLQIHHQSHAALELRHAHRQRTADAQDHRDDGDQVGRPARRPHPPAAERAAHARPGQVAGPAPEAEIGQRQARHAEDRPAVQAPVEQAQGDGVACRFGRAALDPGRGRVVHNRLGHAPVEQARPHAGGEQHGQPGGCREFGPLVRMAQADAAVAAQRQPGAQHQQPRGQRQEEPVDRAEHRVGGGSRPVAQDARPGQAQCRHRARRRQGDQKLGVARGPPCRAGQSACQESQRVGRQAWRHGH